jgi:hypothetical protein
MIQYREAQTFPQDELESLFSSVGWRMGENPGELIENEGKWDKLNFGQDITKSIDETDT